MYESWSLVFRYIFVGLGGLILLLVILWYLRDARRYHKVIKSLPDAGRIGELRCDANGKRYPLPREGYIGRSFSCDIRVRGQGIKNRHVEFIYRPGKGLLMRPVGNNVFSMAGQQLRGSAYALHGTRLEIGNLPFTVLFFEGLDAEDPRDLREDEDRYRRFEEMDGEEDFSSFAPPPPVRYDQPAPAAYHAPVSGAEIPEEWGAAPRSNGTGSPYPVMPEQAPSPRQPQADRYGIPDEWGQRPAAGAQYPVYPVQNQGDE